jgi:hypothetical protein
MTRDARYFQGYYQRNRVKKDAAALEWKRKNRASANARQERYRKNNLEKRAAHAKVNRALKSWCGPFLAKTVKKNVNHMHIILIILKG